MKLESTKLFPKNYSCGASSVFAIAGDVDPCVAVLQHCEAALERRGDPSLSGAAARQIVEDTIAVDFQQRVFPSRRPVSIALTFGVYCPGDRKVAAYRNQDAFVRELVGYSLAGCGIDLGNYLLREKYNAARGQRGNLEPVFRAAVESFKTIKAFADGCGGVTELIWMRDDGTVSPRVSAGGDAESDWTDALAKLRAR